MVVVGERGRYEAHLGEQLAHADHDHGEAQTGEHEVVVEGVGRTAREVRPAARGLLGGLEAGKSFEPRSASERVIAEDPPPEVEQGVGDRGHLPVEHGHHLEVAVHEVAQSRVAPDEGRPALGLGRPVAAQPRNRFARKGMRFVGFGPPQEPLVALELGERRVGNDGEAATHDRELVEWDLVNRGHRLDPTCPRACLLLRSRIRQPPGGRVRRVVARDVAEDAVHDPEPPAEPRLVRLEPMDGNHRDAGSRGERAHDLELELEGVVGEDLIRRRRDAHHEIAVAPTRRRPTMWLRRGSSRSRTRCCRGSSRSRRRRR